MIIAKLIGGLGNQLFIYAFGRVVAHKLNKELCLDISFFDHTQPSHMVYGLQPFNIKGLVGNYPYKESTSLVLNSDGDSKINFYGNFSADAFFVDEIETPAFFHGFYQYTRENHRLLITDDFFNEYADIIHNDLKYVYSLSDFAQDIIHEMDKNDSIALHVRHGDYIDNIDFGFCSKEYYQNAIEVITSKVENPKFYIFSDDIEWAKKNLELNYPHTFVDYDEKIDVIGRGHAELLKIMSSCKHFIIANSTYSWWAAYLCENKDKIIISPEPWFQNRLAAGVKTIDNRKTIPIPANYSKIFHESENLVYELSENNVVFENMSYNKFSNSFSLNNLNEDSKLFLKNINYNNKNSRFIIKFSIESTNSFNAFKLFFKTLDNNQYNDKNSFTVYYFENDSFDHYILLPDSSLIDDIMIKISAFGNTDNLIIHSIEIKELVNFNIF